MSNPIVDAIRLAEVAKRGLESGAHNDTEDGMCAMEAASYIANEPWSDHPKCVDPVIAAFLRNWNDNLDHADRNRLITPDLIALTVGTRGSPSLSERRSMLATDWLIRTHTVAWLRLAKLDTQADLLAGLPEITSMAQMPSIRAPLEAVCKDAAAARVAAGVAAWVAARVAARAAARDAARVAARVAARAAARDAARVAAGVAAWNAARDAAWAAARDAARVAAGVAAWNAARDAAWNAARDAAWDAAGVALASTKAELQLSARTLIERMCAIGVPA